MRHLEKVVMRDNVFISSIRHSETSRNCAKFFKPNSFVKMQCVGVGSNNCVKLQNTKLLFFCHFQTVKNQLFTDMQPADIGFLSYQEPMPYEWIPLNYNEMLAILLKDHPYATKESYPLINCETDSFIMPALGRDDDVVSLFDRNGIVM